MASEPKKPMEQMLEALAKARRAQFGDDPKMPNPVRARLHEEIARAGASQHERAESRPSWITMFWPRVTVAAALATLLVLVPAILWNQSRPNTERGNVAVRDRSAAAYDGLNRAVPAQDTLAKAPSVSAPQQPMNLADNSQIKVEPGSAASSESEALKSSTGFAQGRGANELPNQPTKGVMDNKIAGAKIQAAPAAAPAAGSESKAKSDRIAGIAPPVTQQSSAGGLATTQQFSQQSAAQSFRNNVQSSRATNVLNTFQVQQEGNEIRVVDADGSTYTGKIEQSANTPQVDSRTTSRRDLAKQTPKYAAQAVSENKPVLTQSYFRATGYNVTLQRTLVFEGNYETPSPQEPTLARSKDRERAEQSSDRPRIVGTARVNGEAPVEVDATAETPQPESATKSEK